MRTDESLRKKNFDAFEKRYGFRPAVDPNENEKYSMLRAQNGEPVLCINDASTGKRFRLHSEYDPEYEADVWAKKYDLVYRKTTVAVLGISCGYFLVALINRFRPDTMFFVFEPEESLFSYICGFIDLTRIISHNRVKLYICDRQYNAMSDDMLLDQAAFKPDTKAITTPYYSKNELFSGICHRIEAQAATKMIYQAGLSRLSLKNRLYAWTHMDKSYFLSELKGKIPENISAVIVASGPSLNKNVDQLKRIKGHALIICVDRSVSVLEKHGIEPDLIITLDPEKSTDYFGTEILKNSYLIISYQANTDAQKLFENRRIFYHALSYERELLGEGAGSQGIDQGGNVAGGAFVVCTLLGIKRITLIGQDLAYDGNKHHADDVEEGDPIVSQRTIEGIDGKPVQSNEMWISFKNFYERQIEINPELEVIDATEGGALIKGTKIKKLSEVADDISEESIDFCGIIKNIKKAQNKEEREITISKLRNWVSDLEEIGSFSDEMVILIDQLINICKYQDITDISCKIKINRLNELHINIMSKTVNALMEDFWIRDVYSIPDKMFILRNNEEALLVLEAILPYYSNLHEDIDSLKEEILATISCD